MLPFSIPPIGPRYLPCSFIAAWRCATITSGFACASACEANAAPSMSVAAANSLVLIRSSLERSFHDQVDGERRHGKQDEREPRAGKARRCTSGCSIRRQPLHAGEHRADQVLFHKSKVV